MTHELKEELTERVNRAMSEIIEQRHHTTMNTHQETAVTFYDALNEVYLSLMDRIQSGKLGDMGPEHLRFYILACVKHYLSTPKLNLESLEEIEGRIRAAGGSADYQDETDAAIAGSMVHYDEAMEPERQADVIRMVVTAKKKGSKRPLLNKTELKVFSLHYLAGKRFTWIGERLNMKYVVITHQRIKAKISTLPIRDLYRANVGARIGDPAGTGPRYHYWPIVEDAEEFLTPISLLKRARAAIVKGDPEKAERSILRYRAESQVIRERHEERIRASSKGFEVRRSSRVVFGRRRGRVLAFEGRGRALPGARAGARVSGGAAEQSWGVPVNW